MANAKALFRATKRNIRLNLLWAFACNAGLIPVAVDVVWRATGILLLPLFAAGAGALSSVSVQASSMGLRRFRVPMAKAAQATA